MYLRASLRREKKWNEPKKARLVVHKEIAGFEEDARLLTKYGYVPAHEIARSADTGDYYQWWEPAPGSPAVVAQRIT